VYITLRFHLFVHSHVLYDCHILIHFAAHLVHSSVYIDHVIRDVAHFCFEVLQNQLCLSACVYSKHFMEWLLLLLQVAEAF
jgi:hypothetical protein